jgi:type VI secretion system protein ImpD
MSVIPPVVTPMAGNLLDAVLEATPPGNGRDTSALELFLHEPSPAKALALLLARLRAKVGKEEVVRLLTLVVAQIDRLLARQTNAILHHPAFQKLEASWRGLQYLVWQLPEAGPIKVRVLQLSWKELCRDQERALEFDQSQLFKKVYEEEFGTPGGQPFGVLLGDYDVSHRITAASPTDDVRALRAVSSVAAAAFAPFIAGAHPSLLGLDSFPELERPLQLPRVFQATEYLAWRSLRDSEDSRFVGLTVPRVLMRLPYDGRPGTHVDSFCFREDVTGAGLEKFLWGTPVYAFGAILIRSFADCGWFAEIRGASPDAKLAGGLVADLLVYSHRTDRQGLAPRPSTDAYVTDQLERELGDLGFIALCHCRDTDVAAFYGNQSLNKPRHYDEPEATANAKLSAMLQYMLCVSRFAHYLKVMARDKIGSFATPALCEDYLQRWLSTYTSSSDVPDEETRARYPLRESLVRIAELPGKPGTYQCICHLKPHAQLDQVSTTVRLATTLAAGKPAR